MKRPFYSTFAWAYDSLVEGPVKERADFIVAQLRQRQVATGARLLDAGCGTGTYAIAMAERGFYVIGIDSSAELIAEAKRKSSMAGTSVDFVVGDILELPEEIFVDAILCRGVLNDLVKSDSRWAVFPSFARVMPEGGIMIIDVREWDSTVIRKTVNPILEKTVITEKGSLTFRSVTKLRPETLSLLVSETHVLQASQGEETALFDFEMKCWTQKELRALLVAAGFSEIEYFGDYDFSKGGRLHGSLGGSSNSGPKNGKAQ